MDPAHAATIKACCAAAYGSGVAQLLLGGRLHPGGPELTRRLADLLRIGPGDRVLDVASGLGTTAGLLAAERGATVLGVDLSRRLVEAARSEALRSGLSERTRFAIGDAERLPARDAWFDVVLCECALCTFPDQGTAVAEFRRVLRPGGRLGIADVTVDRRRLPPELGTSLAWVLCLAGARSASGYERLLREGGFLRVLIEDHPEAALAIVDTVSARIDAARDLLDHAFDVAAALRLTERIREAIRGGVIGYVLITAAARDILAEPAVAEGRADGAPG